MKLYSLRVCLTFVEGFGIFGASEYKDVGSVRTGDRETSGYSASSEYEGFIRDFLLTVQCDGALLSVNVGDSLRYVTSRSCRTRAMSHRTRPQIYTKLNL